MRSIGEYAFAICGIKDDIVIPEGVTIIPSNAFYRCSSLNRITLPQSLTTIEEEAFSNCNFKELLLPSHLEKIGENAFTCNAFENVIIPASVKEIGVSPFGSNGHLKSINVDKNNLNYVSIDGVLFSKDMKTLVEYPIGKKDNFYIVPEGVETIADEAFFSADDYLEIIRMPESLLSIGKSAFNFCDATIHLPSGVQSIGVRALEGVIYVPDNSLKRYQEPGIFQSSSFYEPKVDIRPESDFLKLPYYSIEDLLFKPFVQVDLGEKNLWDMTIDDLKKMVDNPKQLEESPFQSKTLGIYKKEGFVEYRKGEKYPNIIFSRLKYNSDTRKVIYLENSISCAGYENELAQYACNILKEKNYTIIKENEEKNAAILVNKEKTEVAFAIPDISGKKVFIGRLPIDSEYYNILLKSIK